MGEELNLDLLRDAYEKLEGLLGLLEDNLSEEQKEYKEVFDQLKTNYDLMKEMMKKDNEVDWQKPTQEMVASAKIVAIKFIESLEQLPFVEENENLKSLLEAAKTTVNALSELAKTAFEFKDYALALKAAEANPAAAVQVAWAGPAVAKNGIDFIRWVAPDLDTTEEMKAIENNVFTKLGGGASGGAMIGAGLGWIGGPAGAAIGGALGGALGSIVGAVSILFEEAELSDVDFKFKIFSSQSQDYVQVRHFSALNQGC